MKGTAPEARWLDISVIDPSRTEGIEDMALLFEYCWSPFRNPAGVEFVDCDILSDPSQWDDEYLDP